MAPGEKPLVWLHGQIKTPPFSREARIEAGYLLGRLQQGENLSQSMNSAKKARLEGAGWKVGTAAEFLGLNKQEAAFVEMKLALARCLHALRIRRKLSQSRVAELVGSSQSRVAKMESGDPSVSIDLLLRSVLAIGGSPAVLVRALASRKKLTPA